MRWLTASGWVWVFVLALLLLLNQPRDVQSLSPVSPASHTRSSSRNPIKINRGSTASTDTTTHTFRLPDPNPDAVNSQHHQGDAIRAAKRQTQITPQQPAQPLTTSQPASFTLPPRPPIKVDTAGEMYEEAVWRRWDGDCMDARLGEYHYSLCPFHNITQRGLQLADLNVVLGIWSGWDTTSSRQLAMTFNDGTSCSDQLNRTTTVLLHCSAPRSITESSAPLPPLDILAEYSPSYIDAVDEPATCVYVLHWHTPLVCSAYREVADKLDEMIQTQVDSSPTSQSESERSVAGRRAQLAQELNLELESSSVVSADDGQLTDSDNASVLCYLECIAAMSAPEAKADSYRTLCEACGFSEQRDEQEGIT